MGSKRGPGPLPGYIYDARTNRYYREQGAPDHILQRVRRDEAGPQHHDGDGRRTRPPGFADLLVQRSRGSLGTRSTPDTRSQLASALLGASATSREREIAPAEAIESVLVSPKAAFGQWTRPTGSDAVVCIASRPDNISFRLSSFNADGEVLQQDAFPLPSPWESDGGVLSFPTVTSMMSASQPSDEVVLLVAGRRHSELMIYRQSEGVLHSGFWAFGREEVKCASCPSRNGCEAVAVGLKRGISVISIELSSGGSGVAISRAPTIPAGHIRALAFWPASSSSDQELIYGTRSGRVGLVDRRTRRPSALNGYSTRGAVYSLTPCSDRRTVVVASLRSNDRPHGSLEMLDLRSGTNEPVTDYKGHRNEYKQRSVYVADDLDLVAAAGDGGLLRAWSLARGGLADREWHLSDTVRDVAIVGVDLWITRPKSVSILLRDANTH